MVFARKARFLQGKPASGQKIHSDTILTWKIRMGGFCEENFSLQEYLISARFFPRKSFFFLANDVFEGQDLFTQKNYTILHIMFTEWFFTKNVTFYTWNLFLRLFIRKTYFFTTFYMKKCFCIIFFMKNLFFNMDFQNDFHPTCTEITHGILPHVRIRFCFYCSFILKFLGENHNSTSWAGWVR